MCCTAVCLWLLCRCELLRKTGLRYGLLLLKHDFGRRLSLLILCCNMCLCMLDHIFQEVGMQKTSEDPWFNVCCVLRLLCLLQAQVGFHNSRWTLASRLQ